MGVNLSGGAPVTPGAPGGILQAIFDGIGGIGDALAEGIGGLIGGIIDMVLGRYTGDYPPLVDGQLALNERFDLLGTSAYCAAYMAQNYRLGPGRNRALPFDTQIGPNRDAELVQVNRAHLETNDPSTLRNEWCIRLDRAGLWHANTSFVHYGDGYNRTMAEIMVLRPDLTIYSATTLPGVQEKAGGGGLDEGVPVSVSKFFVTPEPGYFVQVRWRFSVTIGIRTVRGGARQSQLSVVQWSDDIENVATNDDPNGTIDDT